MKPITLQGHERPITKLRINKEGDLVFSCAKDKIVNVWYTINGERLGTYGDRQSHAGAVWSLDIDWQTRYLVTGAADNTAKLWDACTGKLVKELETPSAVRTCNFGYSGNNIFFSTDQRMNQPCTMCVIDTRIFSKESCEMAITIPEGGPKVTAQIWSNCDRHVITGHENGDIVTWDVRTKGKVQKAKSHDASITDMQLNKDGTMFISASKDKSAKLFDISDLTCLKTYSSDRPINTASISPKYDHVILGGGQEARDVTTSSAREGKFEAQLFHLVFMEEFARVKGHFGPMNTVQFFADGSGYASGGEDGYLRLQTFDPAYYEFNFEC